MILEKILYLILTDFWEWKIVQKPNFALYSSTILENLEVTLDALNFIRGTIILKAAIYF